MRIQEIVEQPEFSEIKKEVELFTEKMLFQYVDDVNKSSSESEEKEIFDVIWGPVEFNFGEIILLDSPLIQRLRKIKQLGLASYVYCGADYSRFAHTIGVFYLSGKMANMVRKRLPRENGKYNFVQIVRLAALFHDVGHMYFSHVSERYFEKNTEFHRYCEIKEAITEFKKKVNTDVSLHELIGILVVNSPSVRRLLQFVAPYLEGVSVKRNEDLDEIIEYIACLIIGQANGVEILPYYQILNGPVDADKCDYLSRDSHATNVPVAVDIFRLIHKLGVEQGKISASVVNSQIWEGDKNKKAYYPTIKSSAIEALNQLIMARSIMYNSVYYHQKVRTAETMLRKILERMNKLKLTVVTDFTKILLMTDDLFGYYCFDILAQNEIVDQLQMKELADDLNRINYRFLMKRACSIDKGLWSASEQHEYKFQKDILRLEKIDKIREVEDETQKEYEKICHIMGVKDKLNRTFFLMEFPRVTIDDSIQDAVISYGNGEVKRASEIFQAGTWIESKESRNKEQYLVTDCENRDLAFLALQRVLYKKYQVTLKEGAAMCSKVPFEQIKKNRRKLFEKEYYNDSLQLVSDLILERYEEDIAQLCEKFQTYEGAKGSVVNRQRIRTYLEQFMRITLSPKDIFLLIDGVIRILKHAVFINRKCFDENMSVVLGKFLKDTNKFFLCPLGGPKDSAFHMSYYLNDLGDKRECIQVCKSLQEALKLSKSGDKIVFFDDGAYSGNQVSSIFEEYMGVPEEERSTGETHVQPLDEKEKQKLKKRQIGIAYICFMGRNEETIKENAGRLGLHIETIKYMSDMKNKLLDPGESIFDSEEQRKLVRENLQQIGFQILDSVKKENGSYRMGWSLERVMKGALGYNDAQQAVILKSSVPTYTLTAFWVEGGMYEGEVWEPLFYRTDK